MCLRALGGLVSFLPLLTVREVNPLCSSKTAPCTLSSQGSEEKTVVYVVGKAGRQHWQHVYTAVTRGRCRVYVIAEESQLRSAIMRKSVPRKTRLKHFLQNKLSRSCTSPAEFASSSKNPEDSRGPSTQPPASPLSTVTADTVTNDSPGSGDPVADDTLLAFAEGWELSSHDEVDATKDPSQLRGSKRTCCLHDAESPSKILMVGLIFRFYLNTAGLSVLISDCVFLLLLHSAAGLTEQLLLSRLSGFHSASISSWILVWSWLDVAPSAWGWHSG